MYKILLIPIFLFFGLLTVLAQKVETFEEDSVFYPEKLQLYALQNFAVQDSVYFNELELQWNSRYYSNIEKDKVINLSNSLLKKTADFDPTFKELLQTFNLVKESTLPSLSRDSWYDYLFRLVSNKRITEDKIVSFLQFTANLISHGVLTDAKGLRWSADSNFELKLIDNWLNIEFKNTQLSCKYYSDSITINKATGLYIYDNNTWQGKSGVVTWERCNLPAQKVNAQLFDYTINCNEYGYSADSVLFVYKGKVEVPVEGSFIDRVSQAQDSISYLFPIFQSYNKQLVLDNFIPRTEFIGGIYVRGIKLSGYGTKRNFAQLNLFHNDTLLLNLKSMEFNFDGKRLQAERVSTTLYHGVDSIYHPELRLDYIETEQKINLIPYGYLKNSPPFIDSYHNIFFKTNRLLVDLNKNKVFYTPPRGLTLGESKFESINSFDQNLYYQLGGIDWVHPLMRLEQCAAYYYSRILTIEDVASYLKIPESKAIQLCMDMYSHGFLLMNLDRNQIELQEKLYTYLKSDSKLIDYDDMLIVSKGEGLTYNAVLDMRTFDLQLNGVSHIVLSRANRVAIYPKNKQLTLKRNRTIEFDGFLKAGAMTFSGESFIFDYDKFLIELDSVDLEKIAFSEKVTEGGMRLMPNAVSNTIKGISGKLLIDEPYNKSGRKVNDQYPKLITSGNSFIYFDNSTKYGDLYSREDYYFLLDPYKLESLKNADSLVMTMNGTFYSGGLFPAFKDTITLQDDNSFGFTHKLPDLGYPIQGSKTVFYNTLKMNHNGLVGDGKLNFNTSVSRSNRFVFFNDSLMADTLLFIVKQTDNSDVYPNVFSENSNARYYYKDERLVVNNTESNQFIINDVISHVGTISVNNNGIFGSGEASMKQCNMSSDNFLYNLNSFSADRATLRIKGKKENSFPLIVFSVKSHVDLQKGKGYFEAINDSINTHFIKNNYVASLKAFEWDINNSEFTMGNYDSADSTTTSDNNVLDNTYTEFISIDNKKDSLSFRAALAQYNYTDFEINASGVDYIDVADARIFPSNGKVTVDTVGEIKELVNANISFPRTTDFWLVHNANATVAAKNSYTAGGKMTYSFNDSSDQVIDITELFVNDSLYSIAKGNILETDTFRLSDNFMYSGDFSAAATDTSYYLDGGVKVIHAFDMPIGDIEYKGYLNSANIKIPITEDCRSNLTKKPLFSGFIAATDSVHQYAVFTGPKKYASDNVTLASTGNLQYNNESGKFIVASDAKIEDRALAEQYFSFGANTGDVFAEGNITMSNKTAHFKVLSAGEIKLNNENNEITSKLMLGFDFMFNEEVLQLMTSELRSNTNLEAVNTSSEFYNKFSKFLEVDDRQSDVADDKKDKNENESIGLDFLSLKDQKLKHTLFFNNVDMKWIDATHSYISIGKLGLGNINGDEINMFVDGFIEITKSRYFDNVDIYIKASDDQWYYFGYSRSILMTASSSDNYINTIRNMKSKYMSMKVVKGGVGYSFMLADERKISELKQKISLHEQLSSVISSEDKSEDLIEKEETKVTNATESEINEESEIIEF